MPSFLTTSLTNCELSIHKLRFGNVSLHIFSLLPPRLLFHSVLCETVQTGFVCFFFPFRIEILSWKRIAVCILSVSTIASKQTEV